MTRLLAIAALLAAPAFTPAYGQSLNLGGSPGAAPQPVNITAAGGISWSQDDQTVTASGNAQAVRGDVTVTADELVAHYHKAPATGAVSAATPAAGLEQGGGQLTELDAIGHVHIFTPTENAWGDRAVYSLSQKVLVLTGQHLKLTTPHDTITARDSVEYYTEAHMAVARGQALIVADDGRSISADVITGYLASAATPAETAALDNAGSLQKVEAVGHVVIHTTSDTATGDTGVYLPPTGQARLGGNVHITHGPNELAGSDALVNMKTGVATLLAAPGGQVSGVILPNSGGGKP
ncbi:LptA/OstA family protein [Acidocella sp.]|uniref:LptA/OstA family protein n=1 Tax=Acidocella sp. TaxID=50710 RepID=UPI002606AC89|nr:LptA/OstA family protein [Acidocella sp.]